MHGSDGSRVDLYDEIWVAPERSEPVGRPRTNRWLAAGTLVLVLAFLASVLSGPGSVLTGPIGGAAASSDIDSPSSSDFAGASWECAPIGYRVVAEGAPAGADAFVDDAVTRLENASGGTMTFLREPDVSTWAADESGYDGITIGWAPDSVAHWEGDTVGWGGGTVWDDTFVDGDAWLHPDMNELSYTDGYRSAGPILLHELGHAVGLDHVRQSADSLMTPQYNGTTDFTESDRLALQQKGQQACGR